MFAKAALLLVLLCAASAATAADLVDKLRDDSELSQVSQAKPLYMAHIRRSSRRMEGAGGWRRRKQKQNRWSPHKKFNGRPCTVGGKRIVSCVCACMVIHNRILIWSHEPVYVYPLSITQTIPKYTLST